MKDSIPRCRIIPTPITKIHRVRYVTIDSSYQGKHELLAVSTEDGRILFYTTNDHLSGQPDGAPESSIPGAQLRGQLGGKAGGQLSRIKDFEILTAQTCQGSRETFVIACSSNGIVRVWTLNHEELYSPNQSQQQYSPSKAPEDGTPLVNDVRQAGKLLGEYETGNRITCLKAFVMFEPQGTVLDEPGDTAESVDADYTSDSDSR